MKKEVEKLVTLLIMLVAMSIPQDVIAQVQGFWMNNTNDFPKNLPIVGVALKSISNVFEVSNTINLSDDKNNNLPNIAINAKKLNIKTPTEKKDFSEMEKDKYGWGLYAFEKPCYFRSNSNSTNCLKNVKFFITDAIHPLCTTPGKLVWLDLEDFCQSSNYKKIPVYRVVTKDRYSGISMHFSDNKADEKMYIKGTEGFVKTDGNYKRVRADIEEYGQFATELSYQFDSPLFCTDIKPSSTYLSRDKIYLLVERTEDVNQIFATQSALIEDAKKQEKEAEARKAEEAKLPMIMKVESVPQTSSTQEFTTPEKAGYTLIRTKTIAGYKCDFYAEGVRTFRFGNGDFMTFSDRSEYGDQDYKPATTDESMGDWQLHAEDGGIVRRENGIITITNPDGSIVKSSNSQSFHWDYDDDKPRVTRKSFTIDIVTLPGSTTPLKKVSFRNSDNYSVLRTKDGFKGLQAEGLLIGNRLYNANVEGKLTSFAQIVDGLPIPALKTDSVIEVKTKVCKNESGDDAVQLTINYANGDSIVCTGAELGFIVNSGTIHRNGGVLTIKVVNGKNLQILTFPNNDKYIGSFKNESPEGLGSGYSDCLCLSHLACPKLQYCDGTLIKADGKQIEYTRGTSEIEIAAEKKAKDAEAMAIYKQLCNKYGKKYVDAALNKKPIVGMPEELLRKVFNLKLVKENVSGKLYRITGFGWTNSGSTFTNSAILYSVWVSNGRVTSVRIWNN